MKRRLHKTSDNWVLLTPQTIPNCIGNDIKILWNLSDVTRAMTVSSVFEEGIVRVGDKSPLCSTVKNWVLRCLLCGVGRVSLTIETQYL